MISSRILGTFFLVHLMADYQPGTLENHHPSLQRSIIESSFYHILYVANMNQPRPERIQT